MEPFKPGKDAQIEADEILKSIENTLNKKKKPVKFTMKGLTELIDIEGSNPLLLIPGIKEKVNKYKEKPTEENYIDFFEDIEKGLKGGVQDLGYGIGDLITSGIDAAADTNLSERLDEIYEKNKLEDPETLTGEITKILTQYGIPGGAAFKILNRLKIFQRSRKLASTVTKLQKAAENSLSFTIDLENQKISYFDKNINQDLTLEIWPLAASWTNGTGYFLNSPQTTDGVSWEFRNDNLKWPTSSFGKIITASFTSDQPGGGVWYTGSISPGALIPTTQSFDVRTEKDINADVSFVVNQWYLSGNNINRYVVDNYVTSSYIETPIDINNYGFIVKWKDSIENDVSKGSQPDVKFYSIDTYTIYPPQLEFRWDDTIHSSSLSEVQTEDIFMSLDENPGVFYEDSINRFRLNVRPKYPERTYQTGSIYTQNLLLPTASCYAVKDLDTNEYVIDFDSKYTKLSADDVSNYFTIYMNGLEPERNYEILIKTEINKTVLVYRDELYFKVVNG